MRAVFSVFYEFVFLFFFNFLKVKAARVLLDVSLLLKFVCCMSVLYKRVVWTLCCILA